MATDKKITEQTEYLAAQSGDVMPIVDLATGLLKKITTANLLQSINASLSVLNLANTNNVNDIVALAARLTALESLAPTSANFPALKHLFLCNEATGGATLTDSVGGVIWSGSSPVSITNNGDGTINWTNAFDTMSGSWVVPGTGKKVVVIVAGKIAANQSLTFGAVAAGASANRGFRLGIGTGVNSKPLYNDGTTGVAGPTTFRAGTGAAATYAMSIDIAAGATGFKGYDFDGATYHDAGTTPAITPTTLVGENDMPGALSTTVTFANTLIRPAMIAVFHFNAVPSDMQTALTYTHLSALTSPYSKLLPPTWAGLV